MKNFINQHYRELMEILNCIKVGVYIADGSSNTILLNDESEKTGGLKREDILGRSMKELIRMGYVEESSILKALSSGEEESFIQALGDGDHLYITGVPLIEDGEIQLVVCTERDISETMNLKELLKDVEKRYEWGLAHLQKQTIRSQGEIIAASEEMKKVVQNARRVAGLDTTVLIMGESGTGKELLANLLYECSLRENKPFIKINCAAVPENLLESEFFGYERGAFTGADKNGKIGLFELANEGTIFLDEIGELPIQMQSKLLRVLQEKEVMPIGGKKAIPVDVRIISATNVKLEEAVALGTFREDLYYRLNIFPIQIPPLRERKADIRQLASYFVELFNKQYGMNKELTEAGLEVLEDYHWPGNARQLRNIIERIMVSFDGQHISSFQVTRHIVIKNNSKAAEDGGEKSLEERISEFEKQLLIDTLARAGNATEAARYLKVNKSTISRKLKKHGITGK